MRENRFAIVIPVYNHEQRVADVVRGALAHGVPVIVVDDGSTDGTGERIKDIPGIRIIRHDANRGKGAAIKTGFGAAAAAADWAITIDADGQHDPANAVRLMKAARDYPAGERPRPIVIGMREDMTGADVPWTSRFGRGFSNFWVRASGGEWVSDSQSGFRMYPLPEAIHLQVKADRFQFEVEILAKAGWNGIPVVETPVSVTYTPGTPRISHFRPFIDFLRNSGTFCRLIIQRLTIPSIIRRKLSYKNS